MSGTNDREVAAVQGSDDAFPEPFRDGDYGRIHVSDRSVRVGLQQLDRAHPILSGHLFDMEGPREQRTHERKLYV